MVGIVPAKPGQRLTAYLHWIEQNFHGEMNYLARPDRLERRQNLNVILPDAASIICVGLNYFTAVIPPDIASDPSRGRLSNYAWGVDYHQVMTPKLKALGDWLADQNQSSQIANRVYVDTGAILERDHAETAGLGFTGKNTMLIHPQRGSWFFLGELLTTLPLEYDTLRRMPTCGSCTRCLTACPTAAFPQPYVLDARRCISYLTIELKGWIPFELRPLMGNWIYGCDICQDVCPFNRFSQPTADIKFVADGWQSAMPPLTELLQLDDATFKAQYAESPIGRIKRARFIRNVCVAAGNWGSSTAVPYLIPLLHDSEPLIRGHAAWALGQIKAVAGVTAVAHALAQETDEIVAHEMTMSLGQAGY